MTTLLGIIIGVVVCVIGIGYLFIKRFGNKYRG